MGKRGIRGKMEEGGGERKERGRAEEQAGSREMEDKQVLGERMALTPHLPARPKASALLVAGPRLPLRPQLPSPKAQEGRGSEPPCKEQCSLAARIRHLLTGFASSKCV